MAIESSPAFQFYVKEWRSSRSVMRMSMAERGMYLEMLLEQWENLRVPDSPEGCFDLIGGRLAEWKKGWPTLRRAFIAHDDGDGIFNFRLEFERSKQKGNKKRAEDRGRNGGFAKWGGDNSRDAVNRDKRSQRMQAARQKGTHTSDEWAEMLAAYHRCLACGTSGDTVQLVKDHVVPIYQGGDDSITNLQPLCGSCNGSKGPSCIDHRRAAPETQQKWLPGGEMPSGMPRQASEMPRQEPQMPGFPIAIASSIPIATPSAREPEPIEAPADHRDLPDRSRAPRRDGEFGRIYLHRWQLEHLIAVLGPHAEAFELDAWLDALNHRIAHQALPPDPWKFVKGELQAEIGRRGLEVAAETQPTTQNKRISGLMTGGEAFLNRNRRPS